MKKYLPFMLTFVFVSSLSFAEGRIQLGLYSSAITYTEPTVMKEEGTMLGFSGHFSFFSRERFRALEVYYSDGYVDYEGSGSIKNIPDKMLEIRGLFGGLIDVSAAYEMSAYIGIGYRNLNDDSSGLVSSTLAYGYERDQTYIYMPIGVTFRPSQNLHAWGLSGRIEYDFLLSGTNHSSLGDVNGYEDVTLHQSSGYGYRISLGLSRTFKNTSISIEPFYRYWNIADSMVTYDSSNRRWIEPYNNSKELGVSLSVTF
ncbi:hypothetical protein OAH87_06325 [Marinomonas sp.]|nr:hypothetical protein [Marinomonas sp.]MDB4838066.1 hypothetical protein [Marinomonas sp.]